MTQKPIQVDSSTGIPLTPSFHGEDCLGNGEHPGYECCCDECDYYLECFPDWWETKDLCRCQTKAVEYAK